ncbi:MAG TPA: DUF3429 domain-containing protein [Parvularculaceae bacterium]|nr:DUF3429 domain-containing protein [Parvularculaceae bacterium]HNS85525.1 DUF3429 domain-containing protein [Parvularculaceae bacterium]
MSRHQEELTSLGFLSLTPFVLGAAVLWLSPFIIPMWVALNVHTLVLTYGGVVAAYIAGVGAGAALKSHAPQSFAPGMIAALAAWFAILHGGFLTLSAPAVWRYVILIIVFVWLLMRDLRAVDDLPSWYGALRTRLTFWAAISLTLIMARLLAWGYY